LSITARIAQLETKLAEQEQLIAQEVATFRGIEAELASLRAGLPSKRALGDVPRTQAILSVLRTSGTSLTPTEILEALEGAGRTETRQLVTATLDHLLKKRLVRRPSRGRYLAV